MSVLNGVLVNGVNYSWGNVKMILFGVPVIGITQINYSRKQTKENNYGFGNEPVGRGYGRIEYEGSIEIYRDEWQKIINAAPNNDPLVIAPFPIPILMGDIPGQGSGIVIPKQVTLHNVEFLEDNFSANEGDTKLMVTVPLIIAGITQDF